MRRQVTIGKVLKIMLICSERDKFLGEKKSSMKTPRKAHLHEENVDYATMGPGIYLY